MNKENKILALGAESCGRFSFFCNGEIFTSRDFGDLIIADNFEKFSKAVISFFKEKKYFPDKIIIDLHPNYNQSQLGAELSRKWKTSLIKIQHHIAHIYSTACEYNLKEFMGIAVDGTGLGSDGKIWGGEIFETRGGKVKRVGSLEEQILVGGDLAVKEPARVLMVVLSKFLNKEGVYDVIKKFYGRNEFEVLYNQLKQNFNCHLSSSAGRVLDAVSCLLFGINQRDFKHQAAFYLEKNSTKPYSGLEPIIKRDKLKIYRLQTMPLFEYLTKNIQRDKKRLAATVYKYIADGLVKIVKKQNKNKLPIVASGGLSSNRIFNDIFEKNGILMAKKNPPGDGGLSIGQIWAYLNLKGRVF